ncbi:hypothetical protein Nmel_003925 [Mimus melanotis]
MPSPVEPAAPGQRGPDLCFKQLRGKSLFSAGRGEEVSPALPRLCRGPAHPPLGGSRARAAAARGRRVFATRRGGRERCLGWFPAPPASSRPRCRRTPLRGTGGSLQHKRSPRTCPAAAASALCKSRGGPASGLERGGPGGRRGAGGAGHRPRDQWRPRLYGSSAGRRRVPAVSPLLCSRRRRLGPAPAVPPGRSRDRFGSQADGPLLSSRGFSKPSEESGIFRSFLYIRPLQDLEMSTTLLSAFYDIDFLCKTEKSLTNLSSMLDKKAVGTPVTPPSSSFAPGFLRRHSTSNLTALAGGSKFPSPTGSSSSSTSSSSSSSSSSSFGNLKETGSGGGGGSSSPTALLNKENKFRDRSFSENGERSQHLMQQLQQQQQAAGKGSGSGGGGGAPINSTRYKTELCRPFEESGACKYGEKCQFAHGFHELRSLTRHPNPGGSRTPPPPASASYCEELLSPPCANNAFQPLRRLSESPVFDAPPSPPDSLSDRESYLSGSLSSGSLSGSELGPPPAHLQPPLHLRRLRERGAAAGGAPRRPCNLPVSSIVVCCDSCSVEGLNTTKHTPSRVPWSGGMLLLTTCILVEV